MVIFAILGACKKKSPEPSVPPFIAEDQEYQKQQSEYKKRYKAFKILPEIYGDPKIFSTPRLQFAWSAPIPGSKIKNEKRFTIWSIKLDGKDLRRAVDGKLLYKYGGNMVHPPVRSPNNRYIVASIYDSDMEGEGLGDDILKVLIDLKERTNTIIHRGGLVPYFQWTADSQTITFYCDVNFWKYHLPSKKLSIMPSIRSRGIYILKDKNQFMAMDEEGFTIYSFSGKKLRRVSLGKNINNKHATTPNGELLMYQSDRMYIIKTKDPKHPLFTGRKFNSMAGAEGHFDEMSIPTATFGPKGKSLYFYYFYKGAIYKLEIVQKKVSPIFDPNMGSGIDFLSLINDMS